MKIYADSYYVEFLKPDTFLQFDEINTIPSDVDVIAISFYTGDLIEPQQVIDTLLPKTKQLFVTLVETVDHKLVNFLRHNNSPKIQFFIDAVLNYPIHNVKTINSWFMCPTNFYVTAPWAKYLLGKLQPVNKRPKFFDCLLGTKKPHRDQVELLYSNSEHQDKIIFSYFKDNLRNGNWNVDLPDTIKFTADSVRYQDSQPPLSALLPVEIYNQSYYSIIAETTAHNDYNQYTEKTAKPILAKRLFVAFAGQNYLRNLRNMGFMTFDTIIDESYDTISDSHTRFVKAWQQVEYLCSIDPDQVTESIKSIVEHNQQNFLNTNWHANILLT